MSTINQFSLSTTLSFNNYRSSFNQFNLNSISRTNSNLNNSNLNGNLNTINSNLNQLIRDELNDVNLCNKINFGKKENAISVNKFLNQRSYGNRTPNLSSDYGLHHLITNSLLKEDQIRIDGRVDKIYSSTFLNDNFIICGTKCNKVRGKFCLNTPSKHCFKINLFNSSTANLN